MKQKPVPGSTARPDPDNNLSRGAPGDRAESIRQRAQSRWNRKAQDLDRDDAEIKRTRAAGQAAGTKPVRGPKHKSASDRE
jgi:hypothetical protein